MILETMEGQTDLPRWSETIFSILQGMRKGSLSFSLPDGRTFTITGSEPGPTAHFDIHDDRLFTRVVARWRPGFLRSVYGRLVGYS